MRTIRSKKLRLENVAMKIRAGKIHSVFRILKSRIVTCGRILFFQRAGINFKPKFNILFPRLSIGLNMILNCADSDIGKNLHYVYHFSLSFSHF